MNVTDRSDTENQTLCGSHRVQNKILLFKKVQKKYNTTNHLLKSNLIWLT